MSKVLLQVWKVVTVVAAGLIMLPPAAFAKSALPDFVVLAKQLKPAVVNIGTAKTIKLQRRQHPFGNQFGQDPFQDFFRPFLRRPAAPAGLQTTEPRLRLHHR